MNLKLSGINPALLTPFTKGGKNVDYDKAAGLAERLAKQGVHGLFVCGTTGEGMLLSLEERKRLTEELVKAVGKKLNVIVQAGCLNTQETIELARHAQEAGAPAAAVVAPSFFGYDEPALAAHYSAVAKAVPKLPLLLYNIPKCTGNPLSAGLVKQLSEKHDSIVGMKDSSGAMGYLNTIIDNARPGFGVINGADEYSFQAYLTGAVGTVSSTANVFPELFLSIYQDVQAGKIKNARATHVKLAKACRMFNYGGNIASYKEALRLRGFDAGYVRPPQRELTAGEKKSLAKALQDGKLI